MTTQIPKRTIRLKDGRLLGYAEFGDPDGRPGFYLDGFPGSRLEAKFAHEAANGAGVRIIALDRPGMGLSDFKQGRTFLDWPRDVLAVAAALGLERFAVAGYSGGGPYAAACAIKIPERLTAVGIISSSAPLEAAGLTEEMSGVNRAFFFMGRRLPLLARPVFWFYALAARSPEWFQSAFARSLPECDKAIVERPEIREAFAEGTREAFRQGSRGLAHEFVMYCRPWGFRLEEISVPVFLWQGDADRNAPVSMGHYLAEAIPSCRATFYPGEGHLFLVDRMPEILSALLTVG